MQLLKGIHREISHATKHEHPAFLSTSRTPSQTNQTQLSNAQWASPMGNYHHTMGFSSSFYVLIHRERERFKSFGLKKKMPGRLAGFHNHTSVDTKSFPPGSADAQRWICEAAAEWCFQRDDCVLKMMDVCGIMWETGRWPGCSVADGSALARHLLNQAAGVPLGCF